MEGRRRVLSDRNGGLDVLVLFVAEAPGRLGGERTGVPLSSDQSGRAFERLIAEAGLTRPDIYVTNAALCNPRDDGGRNRAPLPSELASCRSHLVAQLDLVRAPVVVTLGQTALHALDRVESHRLNLRDDVGRPIRWRGRHLIALYHPGSRAMIHRPFERQVEDYRVLGTLVRSLAAVTA